MKTPFFLKLVVLIIITCCDLVVNAAFGQDTLANAKVIKACLPVPFGTIVKMNVQIVDGEELKLKAYQSSFLFKIASVDSIKLSEPIIIDFQDETGSFPNNTFDLYEYLYGKKVGTISYETNTEIRKKYVGKEFVIVAYETGKFTGVPDGYFNYQDVRQDYGFHFKHYLIVVANLNNKMNKP